MKKITQHVNLKIVELSKYQKNIKNDINLTNNNETRITLQKERNRILTKIHNQIRIDENNKINNAIRNIENVPDDSRKMYEAVKNIKRLTPKVQLLIKNENGLTSNEEKQTKIIAEYFKNLFYKNAS